MNCVLCKISRVCPERTYRIGHGINSFRMLLCCPWWRICHTRVYFGPRTWCVMAHSSPWGWNRGPAVQAVMHCSVHLLVGERCMWPLWHNKMDDRWKSASLGYPGGDPDLSNQWKLEPLPLVTKWRRGVMDTVATATYNVTVTYLLSCRQVEDEKVHQWFLPIQ